MCGQFVSDLGLVGICGSERHGDLADVEQLAAVEFCLKLLIGSGKVNNQAVRCDRLVKCVLGLIAEIIGVTLQRHGFLAGLIVGGTQSKGAGAHCGCRLFCPVIVF